MPPVGRRHYQAHFIHWTMNSTRHLSVWSILKRHPNLSPKCPISLTFSFESHPVRYHRTHNRSEQNLQRTNGTTTHSLVFGSSVHSNSAQVIRTMFGIFFLTVFGSRWICFYPFLQYRRGCLFAEGLAFSPRITPCTIPRIGITCRSRDKTSSSKIVQSDGRSTINKLYSRPDGPIIIIQSNT